MLMLITENMPPRLIKVAGNTRPSVINRPFPSSPGPLFKARVSGQPLIWKSFFILMQIKFIFTRKVVHLASF